MYRYRKPKKPVAWWAVAIALVLVFTCAIAGLFGAFRHTIVPQAPAVTQLAETKVIKHWEVTHVFKGNGFGQTPPFVLSDQVRLSWKGNPSSNYFGSYNVIVELYSAEKGSVGNYITTPINTICKDGNISGSTMLLGEEGSSAKVYLSVMSQGDWEITLEELQ